MPSGYAPDMRLTHLRSLYERPGPWASVYFDASRDTADAARLVDLRWRAARAELAGRGADEATLDALEPAVLAQPSVAGRFGVAAFAAHGALALSRILPAPPPAPLASVGDLPHVLPMLVTEGEHVPWLRVVVDRTGADLEGATAGGVHRRGRVVGSGTYPIRKAAPGGWSQRRYQDAAQENWERNAGEVAQAVAGLADRIGAEVLVVAGDVRARSLLLDRLPERWRPRVVSTGTGSRHAEAADPEPLDEVTLRAVAELAAGHVDAAVERFRQQAGRDAAGNGLGAAVRALQRGQVDTLLLVDDPSSTARLWIGREPNEIATDAAELRAMGVAEPRQVRADDALLRALTLTDADLILVGPDEVDLAGGVGVLLRYADASTRTD